MYKLNVQIKEYIDSSIKVGDKVRFIDGSSISLKRNNEQTIYIVDSYPSLTGVPDIIKEIIGTVTEVGITNYCTNISLLDIAYLTDIVVQLGNSEFRTASSMVAKI